MPGGTLQPVGNANHSTRDWEQDDDDQQYTRQLNIPQCPGGNAGTHSAKKTITYTTSADARVNAGIPTVAESYSYSVFRFRTTNWTKYHIAPNRH